MNNSRIAEQRNNLGLSQEELASKLGISQKSISKYEHGDRRPSYETLLAMSSIFNVSVDYLLGVDKVKQETEYISTLTHDEQHILDLYHQDPEGVTELLGSFSSLSKRNKTIILGKCYELEKEDASESSGEAVKEKEIKAAN